MLLMFPDMKVIIQGRDGSQLTTVLPLDSFVNTEAETAADAG